MPTEPTRILKSYLLSTTKLVTTFSIWVSTHAKRWDMKVGFVSNLPKTGLILSFSIEVVVLNRAIPMRITYTPPPHSCSTPILSFASTVVAHQFHHPIALLSSTSYYTKSKIIMILISSLIVHVSSMHIGSYICYMSHWNKTIKKLIKNKNIYRQ